MKIGKYKILIVKEKEPARLEKKTTSKEQLEHYLQQNEMRLNIIIWILITILFLTICSILVPQTHGFYHW